MRALLESKIFKLREIQKEAIKKSLFFRKSFLACAPSGSGKTLIGELCAIYNIFHKFGKSVYLVPFKALATEKYYHFLKSYKKYSINILLSIGDFDVDDRELARADLIVTTYEKLDSILRNFHDKDWIFDISTVIVDEIHVIGENHRGPRLESLIVRLNELLNKPQIIGLSATIANAEFFCSWLNSLGNDTILIQSNERPVPLKYDIQVTQNKNSTIKKIVNSTLNEKGQVLIFLNTRKATQRQAHDLLAQVSNYLGDSDKAKLKKVSETMYEIKGHNKELAKVFKHGIAFHHAGLLSKERKIVEDNYRKRHLKVICCTTTLSAGVNTPARVVILKNFKKFITSGHNIRDFSDFYEDGDGFGYFKAFTANEVFQMLGRAGRPGLDPVGYGIILVTDIEEKIWVEDHYFQLSSLDSPLVPKYNNLTSMLRDMNTLKEQTLLRIYEEKGLSIDDLKRFFERTYFWSIMKDQMKDKYVPIDQLLMIKEISTINILKLHSDPGIVRSLKKSNIPVKISNISSTTLLGHVKSEFGVYTCQFDVDTGIQCSCGFENGISDNFVHQEFAFRFCSHVTAFLLFLLQYSNEKIQKYVEDIVPKAIKDQYILNYLEEKGLIIKSSKNTLKCSQFGKLIIRLYLYPASGVLIRHRLENSEINTYLDLIREAYHILISEGRLRDMKMLNPILDYADEEPLDKILETYHIMAGDLYSVRDNLKRIVMFVGIIARYMSDSDLSLINVTEMAETLQIRIHHGIKEELFDLVLRLPNVGRVRGRIFHDAGYHTADQVRKENYYILHKKTGLGINFCKKLIQQKNHK
ncbi:MAG: DEAD/DEAH box helicase [Promethearchaeota archaeon]